MSLKPNPDTEPGIREPAPLPSSWYSAACKAAFSAFDDPRFVAATAVAGGANRLILSAGGLGFDAVQCGATAFSEIGFDAVAIHAGDMAQSTRLFQPDDVVVGIDSDSPSVASALRAARRAGLKTIGITTRGLTIIDADALVPIPIPTTSKDHADEALVLAHGLALALMAARIEPEAALAREIGNIAETIRAVSRASAGIALDLSEVVSDGSRLVFSRRNEANWVVSALARRWNLHHAPGLATTAIAVHAVDIEDGVWTMMRDDVLIDVDVRDRRSDTSGSPPQRDRTPRPRRFWTFTRQSSTQPGHIKLPGKSAALAALAAFASLSHLVGEITPPTHRPAQQDV